METTGKNAPISITEDEAALYDRQIRLWGLEAQQRMRNATILIYQLKGLATEVIKNIVLAGVGKVVIVDDNNVGEEDLGAGFFFRDEDVGKKRVDAAKSRVEALNPLVTIECVSTPGAFENDLDTLVKVVDLICVTETDRKSLIKVNEACRKWNKLFYAGGTYGLLGYIFCDLLQHNYITPDRSAPKDVPRNVKAALTYPPLQDALRHKWSALTKRQTKELNPAVVFTIFAIWEYESKNGPLQGGIDQVDELEVIANSLLAQAEVNQQILAKVPREMLETASTTSCHEFSPVCAVVGGMLAQDILKALSAKEVPIANFFTFDGNTGGGTVCRMNIV